MSARLIKDRNADTSKDLLNSQNKKSVNKLAFYLIICVCISESLITSMPSRHMTS